jgi:hypothetical protein
VAAEQEFRKAFVDWSRDSINMNRRKEQQANCLTAATQKSTFSTGTGSEIPLPAVPSGWTSRLDRRAKYNQGLCTNSQCGLCAAMRGNVPDPRPYNASANVNTTNVIALTLGEGGDCEAEYSRRNLKCSTSCGCNNGFIMDKYRARLVKGHALAKCWKWFVEFESNLLHLSVVAGGHPTLQPLTSRQPNSDSSCDSLHGEIWSGKSGLLWHRRDFAADSY